MSTWPFCLPLAHIYVCVGRCISLAHSRSFHLQMKPIVELEIIIDETNLQKPENCRVRAHSIRVPLKDVTYDSQSCLCIDISVQTVYIYCEFKKNDTCP